ncbi:MAG: EamA family transporter [bacterium]|nr:MAG: EamA family transporter [bacterium]
MRREAALLMLVGAALCWSLGGVLIKWVQLDAMAIAGGRSAIAAVVVFLAFPRMKITGSFYQLVGAAAYTATMITFVIANKMTTAANAILLQYTAPAWVALFGAWFLKERTNRRDLATISLVTGGMILFFLERLTVSGFWGNMVAVVSGFSFAWLILLTRRQKEATPYGSILIGNIVTALVCLPFMLRKAPDAEGWAGLILLGVVQLGMAYVFFGIATRYVTALDAAIILLIEPVLNPVWTFLGVGEVPSLLSVMGGAVILGAVTFRAARPQQGARRDTLPRGG